MRILRAKEMKKILGVSMSTLYRMIPTMPARVRIGKTAVGWLESDIEEWLEERREVQIDEKK